MEQEVHQIWDGSDALAAHVSKPKPRPVNALGSQHQNTENDQLQTAN